MTRTTVCFWVVSSLGLLAGCASMSMDPPHEAASGADKLPIVTHAPSLASAPLTHEERIEVASFVENLVGYRTILDGTAPTLRNAKIAGPVEYSSPLQSKQTYFCVSAEIEQPLSGIIPEVRRASLRVVTTKGEKRLGFKAEVLPDGLLSQPPECHGPFEPFPELEKVRNDRRQKMGKPIVP